MIKKALKVVLKAQIQLRFLGVTPNLALNALIKLE